MIREKILNLKQKKNEKKNGTVRKLRYRKHKERLWNIVKTATILWVIAEIAYDAFWEGHNEGMKEEARWIEERLEERPEDLDEWYDFPDNVEIHKIDKIDFTDPDDVRFRGNENEGDQE